MCARVRCPSESCGASFDVPADRLGRSGRCPRCAVRMTVRPVGVEARLRAQERRITGREPSTTAGRLPLGALVDNVRSLWNVGSIFRTADACGVREVVLAGITGHPPRPRIAKTALGADEAVAWSYVADARAGLRRLTERGFVPVAVENSARAAPLDAFEWPARPCIVIGNEVAGVSPEVLDECPIQVTIPMLGVKDSLNVAVAFGIAAYAASRALLSRAVAEPPLPSAAGRNRR